MTGRARARSWFALVVSGALAASALIVMPGLAAAAEEPRTFALVGSLQQRAGLLRRLAARRAPRPSSSPRARPASTPPSSRCPAGTYEYKVAVDDAWDESYGLNGGGDNIPLTVAGRHPGAVRVRRQHSSASASRPPASRGAYDEASDDALVADPVRQPGSDEQFYFVMTDRFANGDTSNDTGGLTGDRLATGFDPTDKGFYNGGDLAGLREQLDYIEGLGTTAIWLTPSFKNRPVQGEGANASAGYHGYWITDFTQIDPHLGTNAELEALIADAHAAGIKVYFDIITNHTADVIDYAEGQYSYIDQATSPYLDADGDGVRPGRLRRHRHVPRARRRDELPVHAGGRRRGRRPQGARRGSTTRRCTTTAATRPGRASRSRSATSSASTT